MHPPGAHTRFPGKSETRVAINGNLSDLSLADLLQTISLSRKTGLLEICGDGEVAWIGVSQGGVVRIAFSEQVLELESALKAAGLDSTASEDEKDRVVWDTAIRSVLSIFEWDDGEFRFEPGDDADAVWCGPEGLHLPTPLSPEYLALEGARLEDERSEVSAAAESAVPAPNLESEPAAEEPAEAAAAASTLPAAIIAIDDDDALLERLKRCAADAGLMMHRFRDPEQVLQRVQHYTLRGEVPCVIVGEGVGADSRSPDRRWDRLIERIHRMSNQAPVLLLRISSAPLSVAVSGSFARTDGPTSSPEERERLVGEVLSYLGVDA